ncbi:MAG: hypothetical protein ACE5DN_06580, partial [Flavobacteriales bacterium]
NVPVFLPPAGNKKAWILGLAGGHMRHMLDNFRLLRRAALEAENKYVPEQHDKEIAAMSWEGLSDEEKQAVPPLLVIGSYADDEQTLASDALAALPPSCPVKFIMLCHTGLDSPLDIPGIALNNVLNCISMNRVFILQSAMHTPEHLSEGLLQAIQHRGSALLHLYLPDFIEDASWVEQSRQALLARLFPLMKYDPERNCNTIASRIDLSANPSPDDSVRIALDYLEDGEEKQLLYAVTAADLAFRLPALFSKFRKWNDEDGDACYVCDYLKLKPDDRSKRVPVIAVVDSDRSLLKYIVPQQVIAKTESVMLAWEILRDLAGMLAEFPEKVKATIEKELNEQHDRVVKEIEKSFEEKLAQKEREQLEAMRVRIKEKLLALSGREKD